MACIVLLSWALKGRVTNPRKVLHILTGGIVFFWWAFDTREIMAGLAAFPFIIVLLLASPISPVGFLRKSPLGTRSEEGHAYGLVLYAVSWTVIAYALFDDLFAASIAIAAMSFGDGMGELIGRRYGTVAITRNRTAQGSAAVFASTFAAVIVLDWFYFGIVGYSTGGPPEMLLPFAGAVAAFVTCLEAITPGKIDNLVIPLLVAFYLHFLGV